MTGESHNGLRPVLGVLCRAALREAIPMPAAEWSGQTKDHVAGCADCAARVSASVHLAGWLASAARPLTPEALRGRAGELLASIHQRVVEQSESGPLGTWVAAADVTMPHVSIPHEAVSEGAVDCAEAVIGDRVRLASRLVSEPVAPEASVWSQVRRSILDTVAVDRASQDPAAQDSAAGEPVEAAQVVGSAAAPAPSMPGREVSAARLVNFRLKITFAGAAACVAIGLLAVASGGFATGGDHLGEQPQFVIVDLGRAPDMDFAVARYGLRH